MEKDKLIQHLVHSHTGMKVSLSHAKAIYDDLLEHFSEEIQGEKGLSLKGIGKITVKPSPERIVRNPKTGQEMVKPENKRVAFKPSAALKQAVNN